MTHNKHDNSDFDGFDFSMDDIEHYLSDADKREQDDDPDYEEVRSMYDTAQVRARFIINNHEFTFMVTGKATEKDKAEQVDKLFRQVRDHDAVSPDMPDEELRTKIQQTVDYIHGRVEEKIQRGGVSHEVNNLVSRFMVDLRKIARKLSEEDQEDLSAVTMICRRDGRHPLVQLFESMIRESMGEDSESEESGIAYLGHTMNPSSATLPMLAAPLLVSLPEVVSMIPFMVGMYLDPDKAKQAGEPSIQVRETLRNMAAELFGQDSTEQFRMLMLNIAYTILLCRDGELTEFHEEYLKDIFV